jgi:hypothetical protein
VNFVSAIQANDPSNFSEIAAFNSAGQLVAECNDGAVDAIRFGDDTCITVAPGQPAGTLVPALWTVSDSLADISTVLIGSTDPISKSEISDIEFGTPHSVPEPGPLGLMAAGLAAIGLACWRPRAARS